jgi:S1-C subfamily serine protease
VEPSFVIRFGENHLIDLIERSDSYPHPLQRWVVPVLPLHQPEVSTGSAFFVAPGLAITAGHVVVDDARDDGATQILYLSDDPLGGTEPWGGLIAVRSVNYNTGHDLAVVTLRWGTIDGQPLPVDTYRLTVDPPPIGDPVFAFGYTSVDVRRELDQVKLDQKVTAVRGVIEELLPEGRDRLLVRYPAARGDFPSPGGMSGGPVLDQRGRVFGVVSRSMKPSDEIESWTSYASLIEPVLDLPFDWTVEGSERQTTLRELAKLGLVPHDGSIA